MLMVVTILIGYIGYSERSDYFKFDFMERVVLSQVQGALQGYADNNEGKYPQADNWYDEMMSDKKYPYAEEEFNVVLNPHALKFGDNMPDDMVLGFICYSGSWGQVGVYDEKVHDVGPILRYKTRDEKYSSSYNTIRIADAKYLKWTTDEPEIPVQKVTGVYSIMVCLILLLFSVMVKNRKYIIQNIIMMICISVLSIIIGGQFVQWAIDLYIGFNGKSLHDIYSVIPVLLFVFSCIFVLLMADYRARCQYEKCVGWVTLYGALVGIVCSCVLHCILMYVYDEYTIYPLLTGVPFGAWAGMILGWWAGSWLDRRHGKAIAGIEAVNE